MIIIQDMVSSAACNITLLKTLKYYALKICSNVRISAGKCLCEMSQDVSGIILIDYRIYNLYLDLSCRT